MNTKNFHKMKTVYQMDVCRKSQTNAWFILELSWNSSELKHCVLWLKIIRMSDCTLCQIWAKLLVYHFAGGSGCQRTPYIQFYCEEINATRCVIQKVLLSMQNFAVEKRNVRNINCNFWLFIQCSCTLPVSHNSYRF